MSVIKLDCVRLGPLSWAGQGWAGQGWFDIFVDKEKLDVSQLIANFSFPGNFQKTNIQHQAAEAVGKVCQICR